MNNQNALRIGGVALVVIGLLAVIALRQRLSSSTPEGEGDAAKKKVAVHSMKQTGGQIRTASAPPSHARTAGTKRPVADSSGTTYSLKNTAVLAYGNGREQIGRISNGDVTAGPESFWVDKNGQMYVCDTVNKKIKVYSAAGVLLEEKDMGFAATDLVVADNGDMFVLDMSRGVVEQIGPDGRKKASLELKGKLAETAARLRVDGNEVALQTHEQYEVVLTQDGTADLLSEISEMSARLGLKGLDGKRFQTLRNELRQGEIIVFNDTGTVIRKVTLPVEGQVASIVYLGQDLIDNSYFQVETSAVSGVELSVYRLDPNGNVASVIPQIPNDYSTWTAKLLEVDKAGNIHQMLPTPGGVQINMWQGY